MKFIGIYTLFLDSGNNKGIYVAYTILKVAHGEEGLPLGFRFHPTDEELVSCYLILKVLENIFLGIAIAVVDLNKREPRDLPGRI